MNNWALITGASQGIGTELARLFAQHGENLVLVARDEIRLENIAAELSNRHGIKTRVLAKDLSKPAAPREIFEVLERDNIPVNYLVNNAGFGFQGPFAELALQGELDLMQVNMTALVELTRRFIPPMLARKQGRILNVASTAAYQPGPSMALYYASKAFVLSFSCALAREVEGGGVTVTTLCPGITRTQFHARANLKRSAGFAMMDADDVARIGFRAMLQGKPIVIAGWLNATLAALAKASPNWFTSKIAGKLNGAERPTQK
jgi:short-subunit dehydrogenase